MAKVIDYVRWCGDLTFQEKQFVGETNGAASIGNIDCIDG